MRRLIVLLVLLASQETLSLWAQEVSLPVKSGSIRFAAMGDFGTGQPPQYETAQTMVQVHGKFPFTFVLLLGDNIY